MLMTRHRSFIVSILSLIVGLGPVRAQSLDPQTKNHYRADDLALFSSAAEWTIYSLDPWPWEEVDDPFGTPAPANGEPAKTAAPEKPKRKVPPEQEFHGYPILGQTKVAVTDTLKTVISTMDESGRHWDGGVPACFSPRHGIRVIKNGETYDLLICYECLSAKIFRGSESIGTVYFDQRPGMAPRPAFLNGALIRAKVKMPPPPHH